jgi:HlyD family secretion protein
MKRIHSITISLLILGACNNGDPLSDAYGNFEAVDVMVSAEAQGRILALSAEEGEHLAKGETAGIIDTSQLHLRKEQVMASTVAVNTKINTLDAQAASYRVQQANLDRELNRVNRLLEDGAATTRQKEELEGNIALVRSQIVALQTQKATIQAEKQGLLVQVKQIDDQIEKARVINPIDGVVLEKYKEAGEIVAPGQALYKIADTRELILRAYISGNQLSEVKTGDVVTVRFDGPQGLEQTEGTVSWISSQAEFTPKIIQTREERVNLVYAMKVKVANDGRLKIGMPGEIKFR